MKYLQIIHFRLGLSIKKTIHFGVPPFMEPPYAHKRLDVYEPSISTPSPLERKRRPLSIGARVRPQSLVEFWSENRRKIGMERSNIPYGSKHCLRRYLTLQIIPQTLPKKVLGSIGIIFVLFDNRPGMPGFILMRVLHWDWVEAFTSH